MNILNKKTRRSKKTSKKLMDKFQEEIKKDIDTSNKSYLNLFKKTKIKNVKVFDDNNDEFIYEK